MLASNLQAAMLDLELPNHNPNLRCDVGVSISGTLSQRFDSALWYPRRNEVCGKLWGLAGCRYVGRNGPDAVFRVLSEFSKCEW